MSEDEKDTSFGSIRGETNNIRPTRTRGWADERRTSNKSCTTKESKRNWID